MPPAAAAPSAPPFAESERAAAGRTVRRIIIHCSATPDGRAQTVRDIDRWHGERKPPFNREHVWRRRMNPELAHIGYHFVIYINGATATGRHMDEIGAHARGANFDSLGICLIGTSRFRAAQWHSLAELVTLLLAVRCPGARVLGHRDLPGVAKACPGFDVAGWLPDMKAPPDHLLEATP